MSKQQTDQRFFHSSDTLNGFGIHIARTPLFRAKNRQDSLQVQKSLQQLETALNVWSWSKAVVPRVPCKGSPARMTVIVILRMILIIIILVMVRIIIPLLPVTNIQIEIIMK